MDVRVRDDGTGGADAVRGSGIVRLRDQLKALGGLTLASPAGEGTSIVVELPLATTDARALLAESRQPVAVRRRRAGVAQ